MRSSTRAIEAPDEGALKAEIARLGARLFSVRLESGATPDAAGRARFSLNDSLAALLPRRRHPVKVGEFLVFNQELVALLKAGLPIVNGLDILLERQENRASRRSSRTSAISSFRASPSRTPSSRTETSSLGSTRRL